MEISIPTLDSCQCGCGARNTKKAFQQGHDATLKSALIKAILNNEAVTVRTGSVQTTSSAVDYANQYGFASQVHSAVETRRYHATRKAEAAAKREARRSLGKAIAGKLIPCTAKVGRWEYVGQFDQDKQSFTYDDAKGNRKVTTKFAIVA